MNQNRNPNRRSGVAMLVIAWLLIMAGAYWFFGEWEAREANPNPASALSVQRGEVTLKRNRAGHYVAEGEINGRPVILLIDTGATWVALPSALARELGLKRGAAVILQTAAGTSVGYQTRLASVRLGPIEMQDVGALIAEGMDPGTVLLGMNFLKRVELVQRGGEMVLRLPVER